MPNNNTKHPANASFNLELEKKLLERTNQKLDCNLEPKTVEIKNCSVKLDGYDADQKIAAEIWASLEEPKAGQTKKVLTDAFKLIFLESATQTKLKKLLIFASPESSKPFIGKSWGAAALQHFGFETVVVDLTAEEITNLKNAKENYRNGNV